MPEIRNLEQFNREFYAQCQAGTPIQSVTTSEEARFITNFQNTLVDRLGTTRFYHWTAERWVIWDWNAAHQSWSNTAHPFKPLPAWLQERVEEFEKEASKKTPQHVVLLVQDGFDAMVTASLGRPDDVLRMSRILKRIFRNQLGCLRDGPAGRSRPILNLVLLESEPRTGMSGGAIAGGWPYHLAPYIQNIDFPLPDREILLQEIARVAPQQAPEQTEADASPAQAGTDEEKALTTLVNCGLGLTADQFYMALRRLALDTNNPQEFVSHLTDAHYRQLNEAKHSIIRSAEALEIYDFSGANEKVKVIGLDRLTDWLELRRDAFHGSTRKRAPTPAGIILIGYPGTGKSTTAKHVAKQWNVTLVRLDLGKVLNPYVGQSESALRRALIICERVEPVVLWIDELEKGLGRADDAGDSGVTRRLLGNLIIWLQEHAGRVFVVATCNKLDAIPVEFQRRGRFDDVFFVGLPSDLARRAIVEHMIELHWQFTHPNVQESFKILFQDDELSNVFKEKTRRFTGAELESAVKKMAYTPEYQVEDPGIFTPRFVFGRSGRFYDPEILGTPDYDKFHKDSDPFLKQKGKYIEAGEHEQPDAAEPSGATAGPAGASTPGNV
jgi:hypothetical protein